MQEEIRVVGTIDQIEIDFLLDQANRFIEGLYQEMSEGFNLRTGEEIDKESAYLFFRAKERMDNLKMLLQYLAYFVKEASLHALASEELDNSYAQFKGLVKAHIDFLLDDDVKKAIMWEYVRKTPLEEHSLEAFENRISGQHRQLDGLVETAQTPTQGNFFKLFATLCQFSRFWFELKDHQYRRIRRSDFFVYKFSRLLIEKHAH